MREDIKELIGNWRKRNIAGIFCENKSQVNGKILELIPESASVGFCGSRTLEQLEIIKALELRGNKIFNQNAPGLSRDESMSIRRAGAQADYYLASANAVSKNGELVFFSAYGQRIAGIADGRQVIVVCGLNKIAANLEEAIKRARNYVTPLNCKRLNWPAFCLKDGICDSRACFAPEYKRMCCQILVLEAEAASGRLTVLLAGEDLGF